MSKKSLFRITFSYQDAIYEIFARKVTESEMFGFVEVEEFVFGENSSLLVDPSEERLKSEFNSVKRTYVPMHAILRIDEMDGEKKGLAKIREKGNGNKVSVFPLPNVLKNE